MYSKTIAFYIVLFLISASCKRKLDSPIMLFNTTEKKTSNLIKLLDKNLFAQPYRLLNIDSFIILSDFYSSKTYSLINLNSKMSKRIGIVGEGPGEFLKGTVCKEYGNTRELYFYNGMSKKIYFAPIDSFIKDDNYRPKFQIDIKFEFGSVNRLCMINENLFVVQGNIKGKRFGLIDRKGALLVNKVDFPKEDVNLKNQKFPNLAYQGNLCVKPDNSKFTFITFKSANLGIYEVTNSDIKIIKEINLFNPLYSWATFGKDMTSCVPNNASKIGYLDSYCTNKYIYTLYNDKTLVDDNNEPNEFNSNLVLIYDWNGNPIKMLKLDNKVEYICVDSKDQFLYAITSSDESYILSYKL